MSAGRGRTGKPRFSLEPGQAAYGCPGFANARSRPADAASADCVPDWIPCAGSKPDAGPCICASSIVSSAGNLEHAPSRRHRSVPDLHDHARRRRAASAARFGIALPALLRDRDASRPRVSMTRSNGSPRLRTSAQIRQAVVEPFDAGARDAAPSRAAASPRSARRRQRDGPCDANHAASRPVPEPISSTLAGAVGIRCRTPDGHRRPEMPS